MTQITLAEALEQYQALFLAARNLASRTRVEYSTDLTGLITYLQEQALVGTPAHVERRYLEGYLAALDRHGLAGSTRRRKVSAIRSFFSFLEEQGVVPKSPAQKLIPPERDYHEPRRLSDAEYKRLLDVVRYETRDAAIIELILQTGMRLSELAGLRIDDIALPPKISKEAGHVGGVTIRGKGRKMRTVTLNWKACKALWSYLAIRPAVSDEHLFITKFGRGIGSRGIENLVGKYLQEAGIAGASVHSLRHTFATQQVKRGTKLDVVRKALGHSSLKTTSIYVDLAREEMDRELQENAL
jgi:site-specific recombinase XerD